MLSFSTPETYIQYNNDNLCIDIYENFITADSADLLKTAILKYGKFKHPHITKSGTPSRRRNKIIYGDEDFPYYNFIYMGKKITTRIHTWSSLPALKAVRDKISELTGQDYHVCVVQLYNNGEVGIDPHRDKEMMPGTIIASLSLGETRIMRFDRKGFEPINIDLASGSLCLLQPPTNDYWLHSIPKDSTKSVRISLVFRNCENMRPAHRLTGKTPGFPGGTALKG